MLKIISLGCKRKIIRHLLFRNIIDGAMVFIFPYLKNFMHVFSPVFLQSSRKRIFL